MGEQLGFMGAGEYVIDAYYRHMVKRISTIRRKLEEVRRSRASHIMKRKESGVPEVVITGYTSAGKTTLFNRLVSENKFVDGKPFATLETYSRALDLWGKKVVLTDTIGFIDDLPPVLIESFYSTLQEVVEADTILLVIDGSEPQEEIARKLKTSVETLREVGVDRDKIIPVVNKVDKIRMEEVKNLRGLIGRYFNWFVPVSALTGFGVETLKVVLFFKVPGYSIVKVVGEDGVRGLRIGDVTFVAVPSRGAEVREAGITYI